MSSQVAGASERSVRWYILRTKRLREREVVERAQRLGYQAYCPRLRTPLARGRAKRIIGPLFPGYAFVLASFPDAFHALRWMPGVRAWLEFGGQPAFLEEDLVGRLKKEEGRRGYVTPRPPRLHAGDRVEILEGAFRGLEGLFEHYLSPATRVRILLSMASYTARVEVDLERVRKLTA
jgi:transcriptional antiterminator RfaH